MYGQPQLFHPQDKVGVDGGLVAEEEPAMACDVAQPRSQAQIPHYLEAQAAAVFPEKVLLYGMDCACADRPSCSILRTKSASMERGRPERRPLWVQGSAAVKSSLDSDCK